VEGRAVGDVGGVEVFAGAMAEAAMAAVARAGVAVTVATRRVVAMGSWTEAAKVTGNGRSRC